MTTGVGVQWKDLNRNSISTAHVVLPSAPSSQCSQLPVNTVCGSRRNLFSAPSPQKSAELLQNHLVEINEAIKTYCFTMLLPWFSSGELKSFICRLNQCQPRQLASRGDVNISNSNGWFSDARLDNCIDVRQWDPRPHSLPSEIPLQCCDTWHQEINVVAAESIYFPFSPDKQQETVQTWERCRETGWSTEQNRLWGCNITVGHCFCIMKKQHSLHTFNLHVSFVISSLWLGNSQHVQNLNQWWIWDLKKSWAIKGPQFAQRNLFKKRRTWWRIFLTY